MTDHLTRCFACQAEIPAGSPVCPECGAVIRSPATWPDWHGNPQRKGRLPAGWRRDEAPQDDPSFTFDALALDPALVDVHPGRPGQRRFLLGLVISGVVWLLAGLPYEIGDPAGWWDIVWYAAGILTGVLVLRLLVALFQRTRTHGFRPALRWIAS